MGNNYVSIFKKLSNLSSVSEECVKFAKQATQND